MVSFGKVMTKKGADMESLLLVHIDGCRSHSLSRVLIALQENFVRVHE